MVNNQAQKTVENSTAIQAAGDVNYSAGISPAQMVEVIESIQSLVQIYSEQSKDLIELRLEKFREKIIDEFSGDGRGRAEAFSDPDFQGALLDAQKAVARSGNEALEEVLVDLVSQKSHSEKRDRLSLTLNDAISKAASLTNDDFDLLALVFVFKNLQFTSMPGWQELAHFLKIFASPVAEAAAEGNLAISYLESHGCLRTALGGVIHFKSGYEILKVRYPAALTRGMSKKELEEIFPPDSPLWRSTGYVQKSKFDDSLYYIRPGSAAILDEMFKEAGSMDRPGDSYEELTKKYPMSEDEFLDLISPALPHAKAVFEKFDGSGARGAELTAVGMALAHARLSKFDDFKAPLNIWINS